ncbi:MAG: ABC transporter substrate-binding protein [Nitrososphaerota archaeon]|nr:ABC transporter substrate-binding protein [Candidatus Calditenuaceae archaeon]MDW8073736.1 ABC transporter substrate-binding protein [Nitrososphaerota archaeon]
MNRRYALSSLLKTGIVAGAAAGLGGVAGYFSSRLVAERSPPVKEAGVKPIRIGFQVHRTGIGAPYGFWYERVANAAVSYINRTGGIAGRPVELIAEDDETSPAKGAQVVERLVLAHNVDFILGALFSDVVLASGPRAGELKRPYFAVSEGTHVPFGLLNRWCFQPGITDVPGQVTAVAKWIFENLGRRVAMIFPDYAFGHDHRDALTRAAERYGARIVEKIPIPPGETSFTKYFTRIPRDIDVLYHVMVGDVLTFVRELGVFLGRDRPELFGFIDSIEAVPLSAPGLEYLEGTYFWEGFPRYADGYDTPYSRFYRESVGVDENGADKSDPSRVSAYSHMFGVWETLFVIKEVVEQSGYSEPRREDYELFVNSLEEMDWFNEGLWHPQGDKLFNGRLHQSFGHQFISTVRNGRLVVIHRTKIEDSLYEHANDYTKQPLF